VLCGRVVCVCCVLCAVLCVMNVLCVVVCASVCNVYGFLGDSSGFIMDQ